jgi:hypothetical protein
MDSAGVNAVLPTCIPATGASSAGDFPDEVPDSADESPQGIVLGDRPALQHRKSVIGVGDHVQPIRAGRQLPRAPECIALTLHNQGRHSDSEEFVRARSLRLSWRVQRERDREHGIGGEAGCRTAGDAGSGAATANHERAADSQLLNNGDHAPIEGGSSRSHRLAGDSPGLFDPDDRDAFAWKAFRERDEIACLDAAVRSMAQDKGCVRTRRAVLHDSAGAERSIDESLDRPLHTAGTISAGTKTFAHSAAPESLCEGRARDWSFQDHAGARRPHLAVSLPRDLRPASLEHSDVTARTTSLGR